MKRIFILLIATAILGACSKDGVAVYAGYYSFKTGGTVDIRGKVYDISRDTTSIDTIVNNYKVTGREVHDTTYKYHIIRDTLGSRDTSFLRHLVAESGQMHILKDSGDEMILTMNITGGDPVVFTAKCEDGQLTLSPTRRMVGIRPGDDDDDNVSCDLTVSGTGRRYDNMILFRLFYAGKYSYDGLDGVIYDSRVDCIATENE